MIHVRATEVLNEEPLEWGVLRNRLKEDFGLSDLIDGGSTVVKIDEETIRGRGVLEDYFQAGRQVAIVRVDGDKNNCFAYTVKKYNLN